MFEQGLPERFKKPKGWLWGHFTGARGGALRFGTLRTHQTPLAHIVYIEGLSEYAEKTFELARDFNRMACNFSVFDRHGQGKSPRHLDDPHKQHSDGIAADIEDIIKYCRDNIPPGEPVVLLGHSTGALLALLALEKEPQLFKAAILTAPLLGFENRAMRNLEEYYAKLPLPELARKAYIPGGSPWRARRDPTSAMKPAEFSGDPVRAAVHDHWQEKTEKLRTGSPTVEWVQQMCKAILQARDPALLRRIQQPLLVFTAGDDGLVTEGPVQEAVKHLPNATYYRYENGKHELLMEKDDIRKSLLSRTLDFLKKSL